MRYGQSGELGLRPLRRFEVNGCGLGWLYVKAENIVSQHEKSARGNKVAAKGKKIGKACQKAEKSPFCVLGNKVAGSAKRPERHPMKLRPPIGEVKRRCRSEYANVRRGAFVYRAL